GPIAPGLLELYEAQTPSVRAAVRDALLVLPDNARQLLAAVQDGRLARAELGPAGETRLMQYRDADVRTLAAEVLTSEIPAERQQVLADYQQSLTLEADPHAGKQ